MLTSAAVDTQGRQSGFSRPADASPLLTAKHSPSSASKPESGQQRIGGRDNGMKMDVRVNSGSVKVQAPSSQQTYPVSVPADTKSGSSTKLQGTSAHLGYIITVFAVVLSLL